MANGDPSPVGDQDELIHKVIESFLPRFGGGSVLHVDDSAGKHAVHRPEALATLGLELPPDADMPSVIAHQADRGRLLVIEAVAGDGPIDEQRRSHLQKLLQTDHAGLVFVTAFQSRDAIRGFLDKIAWGTAVWAADEPDHLIHFNDSRFLGPYE